MGVLGLLEDGGGGGGRRGGVLGGVGVPVGPVEDLVGQVPQLGGVVQPGVLGHVAAPARLGLDPGPLALVLPAGRLREHAVLPFRVAHGDARVVRHALGALGPLLVMVVVVVAPQGRPLTARAVHAPQAGRRAERAAPVRAGQALHGVLGGEGGAVGLRDAVHHVQVAVRRLQPRPVRAPAPSDPVGQDGVARAPPAVQHGHRPQRVHGWRRSEGGGGGGEREGSGEGEGCGW